MQANTARVFVTGLDRLVAAFTYTASQGGYPEVNFVARYRVAETNTTRYLFKNAVSKWGTGTLNLWA